MKQTALHFLLVACVAIAVACAGTPTAPPAQTLENSRWVLVGLGSDAALIATTQTVPFLDFGEPPGRVSGSGGCNRLAGTYTQAGDALTFGPIAGTRMACADGMQVEDALHAALAATATFRIAGDRLELRDASGALLGAFQARTAD